MSTSSIYLGPCEFKTALARQDELHASVVREADKAIILGFEPRRAVVTLGKRAAAKDRPTDPSLEVFELDRGGQATVHNPGQLVIFPIAPVVSVKAWVDVLWRVTQVTAADFGQVCEWNPACPGLYTSVGKIASLGVRVRSGVSTHGIALNVCNRLEDFRAIPVCGVSGAQMDRLGEGVSVEAVFDGWLKNFERLSERS